MLNFEATLCLAQPLFSVSTSSDVNENNAACKESIDSLAEEARTGNDDAIEMLINFASGANYSYVRQLAEQSLIDLYADPTVSSRSKSQIEEQALAFHEVTETANSAQQENNEFSPHEISAQVLYLAGQRAHSLGQRNTEYRINERLRGQLYKHGNGPEEDKDLLSRGRFVFDSELINGSKQLQHLKPQGHCLDLTNQGAFRKAIGEIAIGLKHGAPATAFVNTGAHWVPLILQLTPNDKVNCYVLDGNHQDGSTLPERIETELTISLGDQVGKFTFKGAAMQAHTPNACGPLAMRLLSDLDRDPDICTPGFDIQTAIETSVNKWIGLDEDQKNAVVTGIRSQLLGATVRAVNANE